MNKRLNEWTNDWMNDWMYEWTSDWLTDLMNEWMKEGTNDWMIEWLNEWLNKWLNEHYCFAQIGSFQLYVDGYQDAQYWTRKFEIDAPPDAVAKEFQNQFERLVVLDYIIRNTGIGQEFRYRRNRDNSFVHLENSYSAPPWRNLLSGALNPTTVIKISF